MDSAPGVEELEVALLLEALQQRFGYDFRGYEPGPLRARLHALMGALSVDSVSALQGQVLHQEAACAALLRALSVAPATLFEAADQWPLLRIAMGACLHTAALPKVWLAECAGAEQAWSLAILLMEEGLHERTEIFATFANEELLAEAREASIAAERLPELAEQYLRSGGNGRLADYFTVEDGRATLLPALRARITWAQYNLVTDASFNEFELIICRRALPAFAPTLRERVLRLFHDSLARFGVLGLDRRFEADDALAGCYQPVFAQHAWYKRVA